MNLKVVNKKVYVVSDIHNDADGFNIVAQLSRQKSEIFIMN